MKKAKFLVLFMIIISSCGDSNDYIRNVYVDIEIDLSLPEFSPLNTVGNSFFIEGGNKGIIIYRFSNYEYNIL